MDLDEMQRAVYDAKSTLANVDRVAKQLGVLLEGRLRSGNLYTSTLRALKKELSNFNLTTGQWKD